MKIKKQYPLFILFLFLITKANAQFIGYYNLHDGGVDVPHSSLFVLPKNEFMLFYLGGYKAGIWKEIDQNNISLIETKTKVNPINIIDKRAENELDLTIDVEGLVKAHPFINFSNDTISTKEFCPIFNDWTNCIDNHYIIKKKKNEFKYLTIVLPKDPRFGERSIKYPYKATSFTFSLKNVSGEYYIHFDEEDLKDKIEFTLSQNGDTYTLDKGGRKLEREDLTAEIKEQIDNVKRQIVKASSLEKMAIILPCIATSSTIIYKPTLKPIFIAKCEGDEEELQTKETEGSLQYFTKIDRVNGIYTVLNYKEGEYDNTNYELALKPDIDTKEILSVDKIVSNSGGYELEITFTENGKKQFAELTKNNIKKPIAIVANKMIISTPIINDSILGGKAIIGVGFSELEANRLVESFKK